MGSNEFDKTINGRLNETQEQLIIIYYQRRGDKFEVMTNNNNKSAPRKSLVNSSSKPNLDLAYWIRDKAGASAEVDHILLHQSQLIPIEVKSGKKVSSKKNYLIEPQNQKKLKGKDK
jgi:predicted AAA+ superfamily ATPase